MALFSALVVKLSKTNQPAFLKHILLDISMLVSLQTSGTTQCHRHCSGKSCSESYIECSKVKCVKFRGTLFSHPAQCRILVLLNFSIAVDLIV